MNKNTLAVGSDQKRRQIVIVVMSGKLLLNFSGPADVFMNADKALQAAGCGEGYSVLAVSATADKKIGTLSGMEIHCDSSAMEIKLPIDTLIIAGNDSVDVDNETYEPFYQWLSTVNEHNTRRICSVCGGAFVLAKAGLLNGRKATTHWS